MSNLPSDEDRSARRPSPVARRAILAAAIGVPLAGAGWWVNDRKPSDLVSRCRFGAYADNEPWTPGAHRLLEEELGGVRLPVSSWFQEFGGTWPQASADSLAAQGGYDVLMCWEPHGIDFDAIVDGEYDEYIRRYVRSAGSFPGLVALRPFHEANGDWYDWAPASGRGYVRDAEHWKQAWRRVVTVGRSVDQPNVQFHFCVNGEDVGGTTAEDLWPGSDFVDIIGSDAYSWTGREASFDSIHDDMYTRLTALHATAEYWVGETGLDDQDGSADWYRQAYSSKQFDRMSTVCWFHIRNFRITLDEQAADVHRSQLRHAPQYAGHARDRNDTRG